MTMTRLLKKLTAAKVLSSQLHKKAMLEFAEKIGLVYFGYVNQHNDEHRLVRGVTVSTRHRDNHYCIGTFEGYDITLVERTDTIVHPGKRSRLHAWLIMAIDLRVQHEIPHIFIGSHSHTDAFYAQLLIKHPHLTKLPLEYLGLRQAAFSKEFVVYAHVADFLSSQYIIDATVANAMVEHFHKLTVEISEGVVYVYAEDQRPSRQLLDRMLQAGLWLAKKIDHSATLR